MSQLSDLRALASKINQLVEDLVTSIESQNLPQPSLAGTYQPIYPLERGADEDKRLALAQCAQDLYELALGPEEITLNRASVTKWDIIVSKILADYDVYAKVPLDGTTTFAELAKSTGLNEALITRVIRYATTMRVFHEDSDGRIAHSAQSSYRAIHPETVRMEKFCQDADLKLGMALPEAICRYPEIGSPAAVPSRTTVSVALSTGHELTYFDWLSSNPAALEEFHFTMSALQKNVMGPGQGIVDNAVWRGLPDMSTVVDVGGSTGHNALLLAQKYTGLNFIVQDLPDVIASSSKAFAARSDTDVPASIRERISFATHDFFQPVDVSADVYLLRFILHDWSDNDCVKILSNLAAAMKPGSKIVIVDMLLQPVDSIPLIRAKTQRAMDMEMMADLAAKERDLADWNTLITQAHEKLRIVAIDPVPGSQMGIALLTVLFE